MRPCRSHFVIPLCLATALLPGCLINTLGGASSQEPGDIEAGLSDGAKGLVAAAFKDIDRDRLYDYHIHVAGLGTGDAGTWVNPAMRAWTSPFRRMRFAVYLDASGVTDIDRADDQFVERLMNLIRHHPAPARYQILAFDHHYEEDGKKNLEHSEFYTPNERVFSLAKKYPESLAPAMSVHPYRTDALQELEKWAGQGGRVVKWLPNAMGIDPSSPKVDPYYDKMRELDLTLLTHAGEEKAVEAEEDQRLGNPLLLRRALDRGVRVIIAHCASLGDSEDLDDPEGKRVSNFELFMRMMDNPKYQGQLFGEVSAMTQFNRLGHPLDTILQRRDLHPRLVNGSDYPLPAINIIVRTGKLAAQGYISDTEREELNEIYDHNPLLFDFVVKRTIRDPYGGNKLSPELFYAKHPINAPKAEDHEDQTDQ